MLRGCAYGWIGCAISAGRGGDRGGRGGGRFDGKPKMRIDAHGGGGANKKQKFDD